MLTTCTTPDNVTDAQILMLRATAITAHDPLMVAICDLALDPAHSDHCVCGARNDCAWLLAQAEYASGSEAVRSLLRSAWGWQ